MSRLAQKVEVAPNAPTASEVESWQNGTTLQTFLANPPSGSDAATGASAANALPALGDADQRATLEAIHYALSEVADGATFVWRRNQGLLHGDIKPTTSFRGHDGSICRHLIVGLRAGPKSRRIEGIACRAPDGQWNLSG